MNLWEHLQALADSTESALDVYETMNSWTLSFTAGPTTIGAGGTSEGFYSRIGKLVHAEFRVQLGTGFAWTGTILVLTLPVPAFVWGGHGLAACLGSWVVRDDSVPEHYTGSIQIAAASSLTASFPGAWDTSSPVFRIDNNTPTIWAAGDVISGVLDYRAA